MSEAAIDGIYRTIEEPDSWPDALHAIAEATGSVGALIMILMPNRSRIAIPSPGLAEAARDYVENWAARDIRSNRIDERQSILSHATVTDEDVVSLEEAETDPFYTVFLRKHDLRYFCASSWVPMRDSTLALSVQRSSAQGEYTPADRENVLMLGRHVERAVRLRGRLIEEQSRREALEVIVEQQGQAVIIVDLAGELQFANAIARKLPKDILSLTGDRLRFGPAMPQREINDLLRQVTGGSRAASGRTIFLPSDTDTPGYALNIMRRPARDIVDLPATADEKAHLVLVLTPVRFEHAFDAAITRDFLRLSMGEARVAALVAAGSPPREVAKSLGLTLETVRFTLKQVYRKTGFKRQSQLAAALSALRALPGPASKP